MLQMDEIKAELADLLQQAKRHAVDAQAFDQPVPDFADLDALNVRLVALSQTMSAGPRLCVPCISTHESWAMTAGHGSTDHGSWAMTTFSAALGRACTHMHASCLQLCCRPCGSQRCTPLLHSLRSLRDLMCCLVRLQPDRALSSATRSLAHQRTRAMQVDVDATTAAWTRYKAFADERAELAQQPWDMLRGQLHRVDDFASQWGKAAEGLEGSPLKLSLLRELDGVRRCAHRHVCTLLPS